MTAIPMGLPGRLYRSAMPHRRDLDPDGQLLDAYEEQTVGVVVQLAADEECLQKGGVELRKEYQARGWTVIYLPTTDFAPLADLGDDASVQRLDDAVASTLKHLRDGRNVVVHCSAGMGRTGTFLALLRKMTTGCAGGEAIEWVRGFVPGAVETSEQRSLVEQWAVE